MFLCFWIQTDSTSFAEFIFPFHWRLSRATFCFGFFSHSVQLWPFLRNFVHKTSEAKTNRSLDAIYCSFIASNERAFVLGICLCANVHFQHFCTVAMLLIIMMMMVIMQAGYKIKNILSADYSNECQTH